MRIHMSNKCKDIIMSKESTSSDFVKQNQVILAKKVPCKTGTMKTDATLQSSGKETFKKDSNNKKIALKFVNGGKCKVKGRNSSTTSDVLGGEQGEFIARKLDNIKLSEGESSLVKFRPRSFGQRTKNYVTGNGNVFKQKKQNALKSKNNRDDRGEEKVKEEPEYEGTTILAASTDERKKNRIHKVRTFKQKETFPCHIPEARVEELLKNQDPTDVQYIEGYLRVNPWCHKYAYLSFPDEQSDLLIVGLRDRNRAFDGDLVVASVNPPEKWNVTPEQTQKTGVVVCVREKIHPRKTVGCIKMHSGLLYPRDQRVPLIKIQRESLEQYSSCLTDSDDILYLAVITNWVNPQFAIGKIEQLVGRIGDIEAEANAILLEHDLDVTPYSQEIVNSLPDSDCSLSEDDIKDREEWRQECVFTIDPSTAVDLDDAVSCKPLENGNYEIGVHISDVTHYLEFLSPLDIQVSKRATTVYMTNNVYHMLPKQLCQLCSLLPGQDKLAFSVIWELTPDAEIVRHRFAKTIINSCCQMAYDHAQQFIENPRNDWPDDFLSIKGNFTLDELSSKVNILHDLAKRMRSKRFENGALRIDQPKLHVRIDRGTGLPVSYSIEEQQDSNRLIEEFMLLANMTVAAQLYDTIPDTALLRNHREPSKQILGLTRDMLLKFGIHLDIKSSASLHASIKRYEEEAESESDDIKMTTKYRMMVVNNLCSKAMARATYKCSSTECTQEELRHYALNVSLYTHFTSPIRRYSDCVVHRLLYSTITDSAPPETWSKKLCKEIAANCNAKKYSAKVAQEKSSELYFTYLIDLNGPIVTMGIVLNVRENFMDVILCQVGIKLRISLGDLKKFAAVKYSLDCSVPTLSISWQQPAITQAISIFTLLYLRVEKHPEYFQLIGNVLPPNQEN